MDFMGRCMLHEVLRIQTHTHTLMHLQQGSMFYILEEQSQSLLEVKQPSPNWRPLQQLKGCQSCPVLFILQDALGKPGLQAPKCQHGQPCLPRMPHAQSAGATVPGRLAVVTRRGCSHGFPNTPNRAVSVGHRAEGNSCLQTWSDLLREGNV